MDITIRPALDAEFDALGEITARAYLDDGLLAFDSGDAYRDALRDVRARATTPGAEVLVAVDGDRLLGNVTFVAGGPLADIAAPDEAEIRMLAVSGEARGRGAGEALVRHCADRARALDGCRRLVLSTQPGMRAAHRLYERLGFVRAPHRDWNPLPDIPHFALLAYELTI
ncbi:GNAT family N-acetyltransferase [Streptomyces abyssomicinicus]|uniref:GNAT family N-acetyltransferase n=1 Tax=Streptomyces abyssomicinicus TaxID=574929 RepID=UPI0012505F7C|nr:GNAT family N-acetyltransferase [Streptomyces abyssomicinicus]